MADYDQYDSHKRKYEEDSPPPAPSSGRRRPTGFSDGPPPTAAAAQSALPPPPAAAQYGSVPPPSGPGDFESIKQSFQQLANRALNSNLLNNNANNPSVTANDNSNYSNNGSKRSKFDDHTPSYTSNYNNNSYSDQKPLYSGHQGGGAPSSHGYTGSKKIEIPNGRVGVIIGKAGETIKNLQNQSGARIQVTRDSDHIPNQPYRTVELMGNPDQIAKAEQLIHEVIAEADAGVSGSGSRKMPGSAGSEQYSLQVPSNKVGLVIGKGGETIKNIQSRSGARVQVIPLHPPPGDMSMERTVQIDGTPEQIEIAKQMVNEVIENRLRNPGMGGGYSQQGYQAQPPTNWAPQPPQGQQPGGYGYMQQPGAYPGAPPQYNQQSYPGYPPQATSAGYTQNWDQSAAPQSQQAPQASGYDYYGQQPQAQQQPGGTPTDNSGYNYNQPPTSAAYGQQGYPQDGYASGYQAPAGQPGYEQLPSNPQSGYDQQHSYGTTTGYGSANTQSQESHPPYTSQAETGQAPPSSQPLQGYMGQPSLNPAYPSHGSNQPGYGMPATSQPGYGTPTFQAGYGPGYGAPPQGQRTPPPNAPAYAQPQQSPSQGGYTQPPAGQPGHPPSQAPTKPGYSQPDGAATRPTAAAPAYGAAAQPGAYPPPYGAPPVTPPSYGQQLPAYYGSGYSQPPAYPAEGNGAATTTPPPASQPGAQQTGAAANKSP